MERDATEVNLSCRVVGNTQEMAEYDACISNSFAAKKPTNILIQPSTETR